MLNAFLVPLSFHCLNDNVHCRVYIMYITYSTHSVFWAFPLICIISPFLCRSPSNHGEGSDSFVNIFQIGGKCGNYQKPSWKYQRLWLYVRNLQQRCKLETNVSKQRSEYFISVLGSYVAKWWSSEKTLIPVLEKYCWEIMARLLELQIKLDLQTAECPNIVLDDLINTM